MRPFATENAVRHGPVPAIEIAAEILESREHLKEDVVQGVAEFEMVRGVNRPVAFLQVQIEDAAIADRLFDRLMGDEVEPRRKFIEQNARYVKNLDV